MKFAAQFFRRRKRRAPFFADARWPVLPIKSNRFSGMKLYSQAADAHNESHWPNRRTKTWIDLMLLCVEAPTLPIFCGRLGACNTLILPAEESFRRRSDHAEPGLTFGLAVQGGFCGEPDRLSSPCSGDASIASEARGNFVSIPGIIMGIKTILTVVIFLTIPITFSAQAAVYSQVIVFGDSLSDD